MMLDAVLNGVEASNEVELLNLNDYQLSHVFQVKIIQH